MNIVCQKFNLDRPAIYRIKVPGRFDENLSDWVEGMTIMVDQEDNGPSITTLTGILVDQAALQGLLRRLYTLGLPLIEVKWIGPASTESFKMVI